MRSWLVVLIAVVALGTARVAREAVADRPDAVGEPYAPSAAAAPIVTLGYREAAADLLWIRFRGYFGGWQATSNGIAGLVDAIVALDPKFHPIYEHGARALSMPDVVEDVKQASYLHAIEVLDRGMTEFPDDWKLPELAGQIYTQDLVTSDPAQRRAWNEKGVLLVESAIRKPGAPIGEATWAATMRTKLGQRERAVEGLREMILITSDAQARKKLIDKLAKLEDADATAIAAELYETKHKFEAAWQRDRPTVPPSIYILLGPQLSPGFDLATLATGGHDIVGSEDVPSVEPLPE